MSLAMPMKAFTKPLYGVGDRAYPSLESLLDDPTELLIPGNSLRRPVGRDLDILSASQYPQGLMQPYEEMEQNPRKRKADSSRDQLYGGIVLAAPASESTHSSSAEQDLPTNQKKARSSKRASVNDADDQAGDKKQRGRPRLDTHDETAADRRRTQIRLAQRAYRHRKETTISALKGKVDSLQTTIEQMNKTFINLHDNMVDAGILNTHYSLGRQLKSATEEFVALSKIAAPDSDDEEEAAIAAITAAEEESEKNKNKRRGSARENANLPTKQPARRPTARRDASINAHSSTDGEADVEELPMLSKNDEGLLMLSQATWPTDNSNIHGLNDVLSFNVTVPDAVIYEPINDKFEIERPLTSARSYQGAYTYSFQETTFARRLHRMCLERAFRNLTNPHVEPEYIKRAFRFTFCFSNRKRMLQRFQEMLKRKAGESLENWNAPFFHIGGAGTHFPRRDEDGNPLYPPNMVSPAKAFGPQPYIEVETPRMEVSIQEMLDNIGFGGVWFDSHDVEQYLKSKGIYLDGQSSFIEVDPAVLSLLKQSTAASDGRTDISSERSPLEAILRTPSPLLPADRFTDPITDPFIAHELSELYAQPSTLFPQSRTQTPKLSQDDMWPEYTSPFSNNNVNHLTGTTTPPQFSDLLNPSGRIGNNGRSPLTFDVEMFLERMIQGSACLGRAPGFRKENIDQALITSLQEGY